MNALSGDILQEDPHDITTSDLQEKFAASDKPPLAASPTADKPPLGTAHFTLATPMPSTPSSPSNSINIQGTTSLPGDDTAVRALNDDGVFMTDEASAASSTAEIVGFGRRQEGDSRKHHVVRVIKNLTEAWLDKDMILHTHVDGDHSKVYSRVMPRLYCRQCGGDSQLVSYDQTYVNWYVNGTQWFEKSFINQFGLLAQHVAHGAASAQEKPQFFGCDFPPDDKWDHVTANIVPRTTVVSDVVVTAAGDFTHFVVMEVVFSGQIIMVYDGYASRTNVRKYVKYAKFLLQSLGVIPITAPGK